MNRSSRKIDNRSMQIAFFSDAIPERNGVGSYYKDLSEHLAGHLESVALFCPGDQTAGYHPYLELPMPGDPSQRVFMPNIGRIRKDLRSSPPDVVIASTPGPYGILGAWMAKRCSIPLCVGYHTRYDKLVEIYWQQGWGKWFGALIKAFNRFLFRLGAVVVATSESMALEARRSGIAAVEVVGTPIAGHFLDAPLQSTSRQVESILFAGRLAPEKNIEDILQAAARLPHVTFRIAGDGPLRRHVEGQARRYPNIEYLGWISRHRMRATIDGCDVLVLPSQVESFGTIALEAMARQKLVVVSANCGLLHWSDLASGVFRMHAGETLLDTIGRIQALPFSHRRRKARLARKAACSLNRHTLQHWIDILRNLSHNHRQRLPMPSPMGAC